MDESKLTPQQKVRLQLERSLIQSSQERVDKAKAFESAIKPVWIGKDGKVKELGQEERSAQIVSNLYYAEGEPMRPIPTGKGVLSVDNRSFLAVPKKKAIAPPTPPPSYYLDILVSYSAWATSFESNNINPPEPPLASGFWQVEYSYPDKIKLDTYPYLSLLPYTEIIGSDSSGLATITGFADSPFYSYKIEIPDSGGEIGFGNNYISAVSDSPDFSTLSLSVNSYISIDGGDFILDKSFVFDFSPDNQQSENFFSSSAYNASYSLEGYVTWEFL